MAGYGQSTHEVVRGIVAQLGKRNLGARNNLRHNEVRDHCGKYYTYHRLSQILQQKTESTGRIGHGIRSVQDNKGIECVVQLYLRGDTDPICTAVDALSNYAIRRQK